MRYTALNHYLGVAGLIILLSGVSAAQIAHEPKKGSTERKAIVDALRVPVECDLKQKIVFTADHLRVSGGWAFLSGTPQTPTGGRPNYTNTKYRAAVESEAFDNNVFALLKRTSGKWRVIKYALGCTDVCFLDWPTIHRAPKSIFPLGG